MYFSLFWKQNLGYIWDRRFSAFSCHGFFYVATIPLIY
jgi:hypothetical protein